MASHTGTTKGARAAATGLSALALAAMLAPTVALGQQPSGSPTAQPATGGNSSGAAPAAPAEAPAPPPPLPWRGSVFFTSTSVSGNVFDRGSRLTYVPSADMTYAFRPRFFIHRWFQFRAAFSFYNELTDTSGTPTVREVRATDTSIDLWFHGIPTIGPLKIWLAPRVIFPTSPESRARTMVLGAGLVAQAALSFENFLRGDLAIIFLGNYVHQFSTYQTGGLQDGGFQRLCTDVSGEQVGSTSCYASASVRGNPHDSLTWAVILAPSWDWFSPGAFFSMTHTFRYVPSTVAGVPTYERPGQIGYAPDPTNNTTYFAAWADFNVSSWLTIEAGYAMARDLRGQQQSTPFGNPFFDQYQDWRLYLQTVWTLDRLYTAIFQRSGQAGGVIRTRNQPRQLSPFVRF